MRNSFSTTAKRSPDIPCPKRPGHHRPGRFFSRLAWLFPLPTAKSTPRLPLPRLSHSINLGYVVIRFLESLWGAVSMSKEAKGATQAAPPLETSSTDRKLSPREKAWEKNTLQPALEKSPERQSEFTTISGHRIRRLYTKADLPNWDPDRDLGFPGEPPYTRGIHSTMHRSRLWTMRQFAGFGTVEDTNQRFRYLLAQS